MYIPFVKEELGGNPEDEDKVITEYRKFIKSLNQNKTREKMEVIGYEELRKATMNNILVIDKQLILYRGINDPRCSQQRRQLYLIQEQLMIDLAKIEREEAKELEGEISSPFK